MAARPTSSTVLVADDHALMREGIRLLLDRQGGYEIVGEAADGNEAMRLAEKLRPDLVLMDIWMPRLSGIEALRRISREGWSKVLVVSMKSSRATVEEAFRAGAAGYVSKASPHKELLKAVETVLSGKTYVSSEIAQHVVDAVVEPSSASGSMLSDLSPREREVLQLVAEGLASKEIADRLHISLATVLTHRSKIMRKLGIHRVSGLVRFAIREGVLEP